MHADALEKKLSALQDRKPLETFVWLRAELPKVASAADTRTQLKLLELIRNAAQPPVASVEDALHNAETFPPSPEMMAVAKAGCQLLGELTQAYFSTAQQLTRWSAAIFKRPLQIATLRAMQIAEAQLRLAYRAFMPAPSSAWPTLHALYALARQQDLEALSLTDQHTTPKNIYISAVLLAIADPAKLSATEFDRVAHCILRCAPFVKLSAAPQRAHSPEKPDARFLVSPNGDSPSRFPHYTADAEHDAGDIVLDCRYILQELQRLITGLEEGLSPRQPGELTDAPVRSHLNTLRKLRRRWGVPRTKRHLRSRFHQHAEVVCGFEPLWIMLAAAAATSARDEAFRNLLPPHATRSEWLILDESPGGMSLRYSEGDAGRMTVGELVGVRPRDHATPIASVVRRAQCQDSGEFEIAVKAIAPRALPMTASVRMDCQEQQVKVIVLPSWAGRTEGTRMLMPSGYARAGMSIHLHEGQWASACRVSDHVERAAGFDLVTISG